VCAVVVRGIIGVALGHVLGGFGAFDVYSLGLVVRLRHRTCASGFI